MHGRDCRHDQADKAEAEEYGWSPQIEIDCYDAVLKGVPTFIDLLGEPDIDLRRAAVFALAWFPETAATSMPELVAMLDHNPDTASVANLALSIGLLGRRADGVDLTMLEPLLRHEAIGVRVAAAVARARDPLSRELVDILIDGILDRETLAMQTEGVLFNEGDLTGYASVMLSTFGKSAVEQIVPALCLALEATNPNQSLNITQAILSLVVSDASPPIRNQPASTLSPLQRVAFETISRYGGWTIRNGSFGNYSSLVRSFGLPYSQETLQAYLDGV